MFLENVRLAMQSFISNKMRTLLSVLGIVIGVASVIAVTSLGNSATQSIQRQIASTGLESLTVMPRGFSREFESNFTVELADSMLANVDGVEYAVPINNSNVYIRSGSNSWNGSANAVFPEYAEVFDYDTAEGSFISTDMNQSADMTLILGSEVADELFPDGDAIGRYVRVFLGRGSRSFKVVGIMETRTASFGQSFDSVVYMPYNTYAQRFSGSDIVGAFALGTAEGADVLAIADELEAFLTSRLGEDSFRVMSPATIAEAASSVTETLQLVLAGIAAISLLVGGIGIMNIMLVAVAERTREIGVRKALGASPAFIRSQFLMESASLTMIGGIIGMLLGLGISVFAVNAFGWEFIPSLSAIVLAVAFSAAIGIFFGYYPAHRASTLDPIIALNYE
ncbi:ABC transporter permease [Salinispira pacifica]|nr:ABC transporter permease [Salinispira pacifica]